MKKPQEVRTVTIQHNDTQHSADYTVESGVVIVRYGMATNQVIPISPASHLHEAKQLLKAILEANRWNF